MIVVGMADYAPMLLRLARHLHSAPQVHFMPGLDSARHFLAAK